MTPRDRLSDLYERWEDSGGALTPEEVCRDCPDDLPAFRALLARVERLHLGPNPAAPEPAATADAPPSGFPAGRYAVEAFHAGGGQGWVYRARDAELGRVVAVKFCRSAATPEGERVRQEAELTGRLAHPGVVAVHGRGRTPDGREFYAMRFVDGPTLKDAARRFHDAPPADPGARNVELRRLVRAVATVCEAVAYAHAQHVVHRDLKPANIILGSFGEVLVMDWGLAKDLRAAGPNDGPPGGPEPASPADDGLTRTGSAKGSPPFMSPEQARGDWPAVGPATDVYALGATLYYVLAGRPPFAGASNDEIVDRVCAGDFPRPRAVNPAVSPPLEAVCLKAMAKEPAGRYPSPLALAADLERWLADEPVSAWREPAAVRARRWVKRHRLAVTGAVAALAVGLIAAVAVAVLQHESNVALGNANGRLDAANADLARTNTDLVAANGREATAKTAALAQRDRADANLVQTRATLHAIRMNSAATALAAGHPELAWSLVRQSLPEPGARDDPRGFEWGYAWHLFDRPPLHAIRGPANPHTILLSPDGNRLAVIASPLTGGEARLTVYDPHTGRVLKAFPPVSSRGLNPIISAASRDLTLFAIPEHTGFPITSGMPNRGGVRLWHLPLSGEAKAGRLLTGGTDYPTAIAVSPDGTLVAASFADGRVTVWDAATGDVRHDITEVAGAGATRHRVNTLRFSRDGALLGVIHGLEVYVIDVARRTVTRPQLAARGERYDLWFTESDGLFVATATDADGRPVADLGAPAPAGPLAFPQAVRPTRVWEYPVGNEDALTVLAGAGQVRVYRRALTPNGAGRATPGDPQLVPFAFPGEAAALGMTPDGRTWAVGEPDGTVTVFRGPTPADLDAFPAGVGGVQAVGFLTGGALAVQGYDLATASGAPGGKFTPRWARPPRTPRVGLGKDNPFLPPGDDAFIPPSLATAADGTRVAYRTPPGLQIADAGWKPLALLPIRPDTGTFRGAAQVAFLAGRDAVAYVDPLPTLALGNLAGRDKQTTEVVTWDLAAGKEVARRQVRAATGGPTAVTALTATADGRRLVIATGDNRVLVWAADGDEKPLHAYRAGGSLTSVAVAGDGSRVAAGGLDGAVWLWTTGRDEPVRLPLHRNAVQAVAFAPDGKALVSTGFEGVVRFWDLELMQERFSVPFGTAAHALTFSPDGRTLAVGSGLSVHLLRAADPAAVAETCRRRFAVLPGDATRRDLVAALWALHRDRARATDPDGARRALDDAIRVAEEAGDRADARAWLTELRAAPR